MKNLVIVLFPAKVDTWVSKRINQEAFGKN